MALHAPRSPVVIFCEHLQKKTAAGDLAAIELLERDEIKPHNISAQRTPWYWAARFPRITVIQWLFAHGIPGMNLPSVINRDGSAIIGPAPLDTAFSHGTEDDYHTFCFLMSKNAQSYDEPLKRATYQRTFFHLATQAQKDEYCEYDQVCHSPDPGSDSSATATPSPGPRAGF